MHVIACDVGQGDAILVSYKNLQLLIDGGNPNGKVNSCLSKYLPFWDREVEVVIVTHSQLDHFGGLIEIFKNYKVKNYITSKVPISTPEYGLLLNAVGSEGSRFIDAPGGISIRYEMMSYDIFYPNANEIKSVVSTKNYDPNDLSLQGMLNIGDFTALFTGDIGENYSERVLDGIPNKNVEYIKVPHHGSKNSLTNNYLKLFDPKLAVISVGKDNTYGHPAKEILDVLEKEKAKILRTDLLGNVHVVTDGKEYWIKNN